MGQQRQDDADAGMASNGQGIYMTPSSQVQKLVDALTFYSNAYGTEYDEDGGNTATKALADAVGLVPQIQKMERILNPDQQMVEKVARAIAKGRLHRDATIGDMVDADYALQAIKLYTQGNADIAGK